MSDEMNLTPHIPVEIDIQLPLHIDLQTFEKAIRSAGTPTEDISGDTLEDLINAWGWAVMIRGDWVHVRGTYGDWTWTEDDEKFFTAIIPWTLDESHIVFEKAAMNSGPHYGITGSDTFEVWLLDGTEVERKIAWETDIFEW